MRIFTNVVILTTLSFMLACQPKLDNPVFPQNNAMRMLDNVPQTYEEQAALLKKLGYDGIEAYGPDTYPALRNALHSQGLKALGNYIAIYIDSVQAYDPVVEEIIANSTDGEVIYFHLHSKKYNNDREAGDRIAADILYKTGRFC